MTGENKKKEPGNRGKVFVLGLDGLTLDLIRPWAKEGKLPTFAKMMEEGTYGDLKSTIPTNSAPAWTSFVTGTNPGKHGILHFQSLGYHTKEYLMNRKSRKCKAIWNILSEKGKKVGVINVPLTYPPEEVNGFFISGMDTPSRHNVFTFPEGLYNELKNSVGNYEIEAKLADAVKIKNDRDRWKFIEAVQNTMNSRIRATKYLMQRYEWDFFLVVFTAADRIQHRFWKYMDNEHPHYDKKKASKFGNAVFEVYRRFDCILKDLLELIDDKATLIVMSDHGFGPSPMKYIDFNNWLAVQNLLKYSKNKHGKKRHQISSIIFNMLRLHMPIWMRHYLRARFRSRVDKMQLKSRFRSIDWSSTKAYSDEHIEIYNTIWANLINRESNGIIDPGKEYEQLQNQIIALLKDFRDPYDNKKAIKRVYKRDEIFKGKNAYKAPDLIVEWQNNAYRTKSINESKSMDYIGTISEKETSQTVSGEHKENGIVFMRGDQILRGVEIDGAEITDLVPTILHLIGVAIPEEMDGKVLKHVFKSEQNEIIKSNESVYIDELDDNILSDSDALKLKDRLKQLGYLE